MRFESSLGHGMAHDWESEEDRRPEAKALSSCPVGGGRWGGKILPPVGHR